MVKIILLLFFAGSLYFVKSNPFDLNGLRIVSRFSDCGEWGGHKEEFLIKATSRDSVFCIFKMYTVNCDTAMKEGFSISQKFLKDTIFILNEKMESSIKNYCDGMLSSMLSSKKNSSIKIPYYPCNYYGLFNADSTLKIEFCEGRNNIDNYLKLKRELGVIGFR